jgi:hypothetical protein
LDEGQIVVGSDHLECRKIGFSLEFKKEKLRGDEIFTNLMSEVNNIVKVEGLFVGDLQPKFNVPG